MWKKLVRFIHNLFFKKSEKINHNYLEDDSYRYFSGESIY